jgi:hypothetical protein
MAALVQIHLMYGSLQAGTVYTGVIAVPVGIHIILSGVVISAVGTLFVLSPVDIAGRRQTAL